MLEAALDELAAVVGATLDAELAAALDEGLAALEELAALDLELAALEAALEAGAELAALDAGAELAELDAGADVGGTAVGAGAEHALIDVHHPRRLVRNESQDSFQRPRGADRASNFAQGRELGLQFLGECIGRCHVQDYTVNSLPRQQFPWCEARHPHRGAPTYLEYLTTCPFMV